ncbi:MAG: TolC family protein [Bacteroides sp.]|nr:TolC family protein [Roseburia sp.]MCM1347100.1 TolC family protein [Bacteroides sp.]MCM1420719.1 TolC family protein [Bacteroides sp.]
MKRYIISSVLVIGLNYSLCAQTTLLSLEECRSKAVENNKELKASHIKLEQTGYDVKAYKANFFPKINLIATDLYSFGKGDLTISGGHLPIYTLDAASGNYLPAVKPDANGQYTMLQYADFPDQKLEYKIKNVFTGGIMFEEPIYMGGKITAAYNMAKLGKQMASQNIRLSQSEIIMKTDEAYALAVKAKELGKVARSYKQTLDELLKNVESAVRHGMKTRNDMMKVQVKINEAELNIQKADNAYRLACMSLCHVTGMPLTSDIGVDENEFSDKKINNHTALVQDISARPEVAILADKVELARQKVKLTKSDFLPNVALAGGYTYNNGIEIAGKKLLDSGTASFMVSVKIPVFNFGEGANKIRSAKAQQRISILEQENANEQMTLELTQCINNITEADTELRLTRKSLEQATENMKMSKQQYEVGFEPLSDFLEAQSLWQQASANEVEARCQLFLAHTKYLKAAGRLQ